MSLDINWDLLSPTDHLQDSLITLLNAHLANAARPSFIGPVTVTAFDFGTAAPDLEIRDIRDVWRVFDQGDEEGDLIEEEKQKEKERKERERLKSEALKSSLDGEKYEMVDYYSPTSEGGESYDEQFEYDLEQQLEAEERARQRGRRPNSYAPTSYPDRPAVHRSMSARSFIPYPFDHPVPTPYLPSTPGLNPSLFSHPLSVRRNPLSASQSVAPIPSRRRLPIAPSSTPPSPPAHPAGLPPSKPASSVPSLQLHLHLSHTSDLHLTLLTSLQVNYPSQLFMALPLKISITGFHIDAGVVLAFNGEKNRVHLTVVDGESGQGPMDGMGGEDKNLSIGQRLLPNLQIESEIGHADAHVLRNVGKVERFILDVVRKTMVDELVFPNFHTVAL
ncbi:mitochondrial distribution and morphology protein 12 [Cryptococcus wingfieldii CBS 7118]|uniref:Mitochondrial distribution and morphology protein 12 n=1 Tax=Cryptococcus wingfieldii CBS 7118 TaxID=1295528 RepID=A0A1E3JPV0_9TREE|nr:mitochondrial distribution and morphology protein 12 [Cryptococcus wingfieldii CBS 7118]ODO01932.1 mitochondrial distribution and morphology protein 12 [Cryptococcus wingfieldii CBS 7118]